MAKAPGIPVYGTRFRFDLRQAHDAPGVVERRLVQAFIGLARQSAVQVLLKVGRLRIATGFIRGLPIAKQPMKTMPSRLAARQ